ncbi:MAG TPA: reactive intermediate/imine deaminase [Lachnospiraceae bacterium]|mgnify:CR=1 FL=1|nr:reactive intermediate/imine deaminase [Lachnospiraceae bacterium]
MKKTIIDAKNAPAAVGPYVHAVKAGNYVFTSGQIGLIPETGVLAQGIAAQTEQVLKNLGAVLAEVGLTYTDVIKTTVFLDSMDDFAVVNEIYAKYFTEDAPARSCVEVAALPKEALVEIEVVAVAG